MWQDTDTTVCRNLNDLTYKLKLIETFPKWLASKLRDYEAFHARDLLWSWWGRASCSFCIRKNQSPPTANLAIQNIWMKVMHSELTGSLTLMQQLYANVHIRGSVKLLKTTTRCSTCNPCTTCLFIRRITRGIFSTMHCVPMILSCPVSLETDWHVSFL